MTRNTIGMVWLLGLLLALGLYVVGPDRFLTDIPAALEHAQVALANLVLGLSEQAFDLVRALAIGLFVVFVGLGVIAAQRGLRARAALAVVSVLFLALTMGDDGGPGGLRWLGALALAGVGAAVMTRRLAQPSVPAAPWPYRG